MMCGENPAGIGYRGQKTVHCDTCTPIQNRVQAGTSKAKISVKPPRPPRDPDEYCKFDSKEWKAFCVVVYSAIPKTGTATVGQMVRTIAGLGYDADEVRGNIQDALEQLAGAGIVRDSWQILPTRYERCEKPTVTPWKYDKTITPKGVHRQKAVNP